jgi:hypothetical protein
MIPGTGTYSIAHLGGSRKLLTPQSRQGLCKFKVARE